MGNFNIFRCLSKITDDKVLECLKDIKGSEATIAYLKLIKYVIHAFVKKDTSDIDRIYYSVFVIYFLRIWRQYQMNNGISKKHFITQTSYEGLEINLILVVRLIITKRLKFLPEISTQENEEFFRKVRSYSPTESIMASCSLKGVMTKMHRIQLEDILLKDIKKSLNINDSHLKKNAKSSLFLSDMDIEFNMKRAVNDAIVECNKLEIYCEHIYLDSFFNPIHENDEEENYEVDEDFLNSENPFFDVNILNEEDEEENLENIHGTEIYPLNEYSCKFYFF